ncbi:hypothetical protein BCR42DRAFT_496389, partial [Absidia repens]
MILKHLLFPRRPYLIVTTTTNNFKRCYNTLNDHYAQLRTDPKVAAQYIQATPSATHNDYLDDFLLFPEFITDEEHAIITQHCEKKLKRSLGRNAPYEPGHFDGVISGYRECSASGWMSHDDDHWMGPFIHDRIYKALFPSHFTWLAPHLLDLAAHGEIRGHVDNIEASGSVVAGLCLKSPAKMVLEHVDDPSCQVAIFLPPRCFYIQRDTVRYQFKHAIMGPEASVWNGKPFEKTDRISLMFRNTKESKS